MDKDNRVEFIRPYLSKELVEWLIWYTAEYEKEKKRLDRIEKYGYWGLCANEVELDINRVVEERDAYLKELRKQLHVMGSAFDWVAEEMFRLGWKRGYEVGKGKRPDSPTAYADDAISMKEEQK